MRIQELLCGVLACILVHELRATGVFVCKLSEVVDLAVNNAPKVYGSSSTCLTTRVSDANLGRSTRECGGDLLTSSRPACYAWPPRNIRGVPRLASLIPSPAVDRWGGGCAPSAPAAAAKGMQPISGPTVSQLRAAGAPRADRSYQSCTLRCLAAGVCRGATSVRRRPPSRAGPSASIESTESPAARAPREPPTVQKPEMTTYGYALWQYTNMS